MTVTLLELNSSIALFTITSHSLLELISALSDMIYKGVLSPSAESQANRNSPCSAPGVTDITESSAMIDSHFGVNSIRSFSLYANPGSANARKLSAEIIISDTTADENFLFIFIHFIITAQILQRE